MPDQPKSEMFMQFVTKKGEALLAECAASKDKEDKWMSDFTPQTYDTYSDFFEVTKFDFGVSVKSQDASKKQTQTQSLHSTPIAGKQHGQHAKSSDAWQSWRAANTDADVDNLKYPFEVDEFGFDRLIDRASVELFAACCTSQTFKSAAFVKRVLTGSGKPGKTFLRIDFKDVLVTSLSWDDGDLLNESCKFICRGFKIQYRRQNAAGDLLEPVVPIE